MEGEIEEVLTAEDFPEVNASEQLVLALPEQFPADPISPMIQTATFSKEETETRAKEKEKEKENAAVGEKKGKLETTLMSALVISSVVAAAAIGAAFLISKLRKT